MTKVRKNIKKFKRFDDIFDEILTKIVPNNTLNEDYYNQAIQYDEKKSLSLFLQKHQQGNIIQKLFLIPKEEKIFCNKCMMNFFQFVYRKYILIRNAKTELLFQKIFRVDKFNKKDKACNFCNGREITELIIETKILDYPEWLIVIIDPNQINSFQLGLNLFISDGKSLLYTLFYFIEANTNFFYKINEQNSIYCNKFENNEYTNPHKLRDKKPIVLFYHLTRNQINIQNNIQNISSQNNQNMMTLNNQQNMNVANALPQQNIQVNQQNNLNSFQNMNNRNIFQTNVIPNINPQLNQNQQNLNNMNFQSNINTQMNNPQNMSNDLNNRPFDEHYVYHNFNGLNNINNNNINNNDNFQNPMNNINGMQNNLNMNFNNNNGNVMINNQNNLMNNFMNNNANNNMINNNNNNNIFGNNNMNMMNNNNMNIFNNVNNQNNPLNKNQIIEIFNNIIVIQFISADLTVNRGIKCLPSDKFAEVEERLYQIYPDLRKTNNHFITNGNQILRFQTIEENKIKDGQVVQLIKND